MGCFLELLIYTSPRRQTAHSDSIQIHASAGNGWTTTVETKSGGSDDPLHVGLHAMRHRRLIPLLPPASCIMVDIVSSTCQLHVRAELE